MNFEICMGVPEMEEFFNGLVAKKKDNLLSKYDEKLFNKLGKALNYLSTNPRHNSLNTHEISSLTRRYGQKVWQSYLENNTSAAGRLFWVYGPKKNQITIIGIEPHPEDKKRNGYNKVNLSELS